MTTPNHKKLSCAKCGSSEVAIMRDMHATRQCLNCRQFWLPKEDGKVPDTFEEKDLLKVIDKLTAKLEVAVEALSSSKSIKAKEALRQMWEIDENDEHLNKRVK